ncbi:MAG: hypothetical protein IKW90_01855 [Lachnospiraceae bacterium]|nr:hypothetical protein [Lachnospiraceae bacterium]
MRIREITQIDNKNIALMDTSSISFLQVLKNKGIKSDIVLKDYDLILIPKWVLNEINDAAGRTEYLQSLIDSGYPIYCIAEETYSNLVDYEEGNLYQIVSASTSLLGRLRAYLRKFVERTDSLDMAEYSTWIQQLYDEWPIPGDNLSNGRIRKKNAGEVSITILAEVISWYYPATEALTVYSQDGDTYEYQRAAETKLREIFVSRIPVPVSYKSNDAILCQLFREKEIDLDGVLSCRTDERRITYSIEKPDHSVVLVTEVVDNESFVTLIQKEAVHIIF